MYNEVKKARLKELKINNKGMSDSATLCESVNFAVVSEKDEEK